MTSTAVIILAAGRGERMGDTHSNGPKQYRNIGGKSVLQNTIDRFSHHPEIGIIQVVIHPDDHKIYHANVVQSEKLASPVNGGKTRQSSGLMGLVALQNAGCEKVLIHDAARPFVPDDTISRVLASIQSGECALPGSSISDTIKRVESGGRVLETVDRSGLFTAQTPQGFMYSEIFRAHQLAASAGLVDFTDDAAVAEWHGLSVKVVEVGRDNLKITTADDIEIAKNQLPNNQGYSMNADIRVGNGYDIHTFETGDRVVLCGVVIPFHKKLKGHSDADVGLHSLTDALLATIADGDIGSHFPPSDPKWRNANSDQFLKHAVNRVSQMNGQITHLDVTLICERPNIGDHRENMRRTISDITGVEVGRISVKATTNEKVGAIGREEGIAALANATVIFSQ